MEKLDFRNTRRDFFLKAMTIGVGGAAALAMSGCQGDGNGTPTGTLSAEQMATLLFMYQEEKMARDIYIYFSELYPEENTFAYIQDSEQRHMDACEKLCLKYGVDISDINEDDLGVFILEDLQTLYNTLTAQGEAGLLEALEVGVLIEETDITDLEEAKDGMPADVVKVFDNLLEGSLNHLDAFNYSISQLTA